MNIDAAVLVEGHAAARSEGFWRGLLTHHSMHAMTSESAWGEERRSKYLRWGDKGGQMGPLHWDGSGATGLHGNHRWCLFAYLPGLHCNEVLLDPL